jgi:diguanylate cyclase (GGDEF)-like protein
MMTTVATKSRTGLVLVAEDDLGTRKWVEMHLRVEGYDVATAPDGPSALRDAISLRPDLVLLDVNMPSMDGLEVCYQLRHDARTKYTPVIMVTGKTLTADRLAGLKAGADDYVVKPFDPDELIARVGLTINRARQMRGVNPLTQLPGNVDIEDEISRRISEPDPFGLLYIDIDDFKSFNDYYGFMKGDEAISLLADCATEVVRNRDGRDGFIGHVGGDDFVVLVSGSVAETVANELIECWDKRIVELYQLEDRARGYIQVPDRRKEMRRYGVLTISIGVVTNIRRPIKTRWQASEIAKEMKARAKSQPGSSISIDQRAGIEPHQERRTPSTPQPLGF